MADEKASTEKAPTQKATPPVEKVEPLVYLYLKHPHTRFELGNVGLPDLVPEGTAYSSPDADVVRVMCMKYGIGYSEEQ